MTGDQPRRSEPGSYLLLFHIEEPVVLEAGRLGRCDLAAGRYVYVGSALGPGGVAGRLNRHLRAAKRLHWHIDYLVQAVRPVGLAFAYGPGRLECQWAHRLWVGAKAAPAAPGFGSSDCRAGCPAHLWRLPADLPLQWLEDELTQCPIQMI